jgi:transcriptional regulator with XRE-family HTH domain
MHAIHPSLPLTLRRARRLHRVSQLELSLRLGVSQRHVSFVESGRARPSRILLLAWLEELGASLATRNDALLQAGFAPAFGETANEALPGTQAGQALAQLLLAHEPMPAFVLDPLWTVRQANRGGMWLATLLMPWIATLPAGAPLNMLDALIHPEGPTRSMLNLREIGPSLLAHIRHEAVSHPALAPKAEAFAALLASRHGDLAGPRWADAGSALPPALTTRFGTPLGELAFFSMFTTFGTPQDITLASLRVEHIFPADEATARIVREAVAKLPESFSLPASGPPPR